MLYGRMFSHPLVSVIRNPQWSMVEGTCRVRSFHSKEAIQTNGEGVSG